MVKFSGSDAGFKSLIGGHYQPMFLIAVIKGMKAACASAQARP
ncbi:hypothetical protein [Neorhizobium galegae]|nr:hypothetical protein [Neorhizobium galegae]